jgi:hypothetical protein
MNKRSLIIFSFLISLLFVGIIIFMIVNKNNEPEQQPSINSREYTNNEIEQHISASDCWVAIGGSVYDLSGYFATNPDETLSSSLCGKIEPETSLPNRLKKEKLLGYRIGLLSP